MEELERPQKHQPPFAVLSTLAPCARLERLAAARGPMAARKEGHMHTLAKDLTIKLQDDRPGALAKALEAIAKTGVNIDGYAEIEGTLHVLTQDAPAARRALESAGVKVSREEDVVVAEVMDRPGVAANIFREIADANVNVTFSYVATDTRIVIGASNVAKVAEIVSKQAAAIR
jgi:hypothetical protein